MNFNQELPQPNPQDEEIFPARRTAPQPASPQSLHPVPPTTLDEATKSALDRCRDAAIQDPDPMAACLSLLAASVLENQIQQEQALSQGTAHGALPSLVDPNSSRVIELVNRGRREACRLVQLATKVRDTKNAHERDVSRTRPPHSEIPRM